MDNAEPSTNGLSAYNLHWLGSLLDDSKYTKLAVQTLAAFEVEISTHPGLFSGMLVSVVATKLGAKCLMISGEGPLADKALRVVRSGVRPTCTVIRIGAGSKETEWLAERNELIRGLDPEKEFVQVCEGSSCRILDESGIDEFFGGI
jgi:uncharacterized protein YyaL (SSP411 family)